MILESEGYIFGETIENKIVQDKIIRIDSNELESANKIEIKSIVNTTKNGIDLRHSIGVISSKIGMKNDKTRVVLERMFLRRKLFNKKFINLSLIEFYAFVINNEDKLKYDFLEAVSQGARQTAIKESSIKKIPFKFPEMNIIRYEKDTQIYEKVYIEIILIVQLSRKVKECLKNIVKFQIRSYAFIKMEKVLMIISL